MIHHLPRHNTAANDNAALAVLAACITDLLLERTAMFCGRHRGQHLQAAALLLRYLRICGGNVYRVVEQRITKQGVQETVEIGSAVYSTSSLLNHSCSPNVFRTYRGAISSWIAILPIEPGQQIFSNYGQSYLYDEVTSRQSSLLEFRFSCQCVACAGQWPLKRHISAGQRVFLCARCGAGLAHGKQVTAKCQRCKKPNYIAKYESFLADVSIELATLTESVTKHRTPLSLYSTRLGELIARLSRIVRYPDVTTVACQELLQDSFMQGGYGNKPG